MDLKVFDTCVREFLLSWVELFRDINVSRSLHKSVCNDACEVW